MGTVTSIVLHPYARALRIRSVDTIAARDTAGFSTRCPVSFARFPINNRLLGKVCFAAVGRRHSTLAILHQTLPIYMEQDPPEETKHLDTVLTASDLETFQKGLQNVRPRVLVLDLPLLGTSPESVVKALEAAAKPELTMIVYAFAKWDLIEAL